MASAWSATSQATTCRVRSIGSSTCQGRGRTGSAFAPSGGFATRFTSIWPIAGSAGSTTAIFFDKGSKRLWRAALGGGEAFAVDPSMVVADAYRQSGVKSSRELASTSNLTVRSASGNAPAAVMSVMENLRI